MEVTQILSIDQYKISSNDSDGITSKLHKAYLEVVHGKWNEFKGWITKIHG